MGKKRKGVWEVQVIGGDLLRGVIWCIKARIGHGALGRQTDWIQLEDDDFRYGCLISRRSG